MLRNLILTVILLILSGTVFYLTLNRLDPLGDQRILSYFSFFVSIFLFISLFFTLFFFFSGELKKRRKLGTRHYLVSLRRGIFVGIFTIGVLVLQMLNIISLAKCSTRYTPETGCAKVIFDTQGIFEVILWAFFLLVVEMIISSGRRT